MVEISLIIPTLRVGDHLNKALESLEGEYDELIIIDDKIDNLAKKINKGLRSATGQFLIVANDDIELAEGSLKELLYLDEVMSPRLSGGLQKNFHAHMFCLPRNIYAEVGGYYEGYNGFYYDDSDYWMKLLKAGYQPKISDKVMIHHHHPASTLKTFPKRHEWEHENQQIFIKRWGADALSIVR